MNRIEQARRRLLAEIADCIFEREELLEELKISMAIESPDRPARLKRQEIVDKRQEIRDVILLKRQELSELKKEKLTIMIIKSKQKKRNALRSLQKESLQIST